MLPSTSAAASAAEIIAKALPRSASVLRREISTRRGVRTSPAPPPVRAPARIRTGVAGGSTSRPMATAVANKPDQDEPARLDPIGQPARRDPERQHGDPVGDEEQPDVGARQLRALRQVGRHDAPVGHVEQRDDERRRPLPAEREAEPSRGERGAGRGGARAVRAPVLARPSRCPARPPVSRTGRTTSTRIPTTTIPTTRSATESSEEPSPRTASESGGIATSVRLWALPMNASPKPRRSGATSRGRATTPPAASARSRSPG